jgi:hypothetical protein
MQAGIGATAMISRMPARRPAGSNDRDISAMCNTRHAGDMDVQRYFGR